MNRGFELEQGKKWVSETGRMLLKEGLVARTWGNISCRMKGEKMIITPSGMGYDNMTEDDVVVMDLATGEWEGSRKPSSEKGIHAGAYEYFEDVNYVIHTHQNFATAIGIVGFDTLDITDEERERLGGIAMAAYGLPGTKTLKNNVLKAYATGARTVFLEHHGVVICGKDREDAFEKSILLETICKRNTKGLPKEGSMQESKDVSEILAEIKKVYPHADVLNSDVALKRASMKGNITAQVDDMAQIIGLNIKHAKPDVEDILKNLKKRDAVMVEGIGVLIKCTDPEDLIPLKMLVDKAVICNLHTKEWGVSGKLSLIDTILMRRVYITKYSKRK